MARLQPETITDQRELAIIHVYRARMSERVKRPNKFELIVLADGMVFDSRLIVKDETPKLDLRERD
jgi:hypothetical protein